MSTGCHPNSMSSASVGPPVTASAAEVHGMNVYELGTTFTQEELEELLPFFIAFNGAAEVSLGNCSVYSKRKGISVMDVPGLGKGLFCEKGTGGRIKRDTAAVYIGTLEVATRYKRLGGRLDYAIALPKLKVRGVYLDIILCGYKMRDATLNAVMINHTCTQEKINTIFELQEVVVFKDYDAVKKKRKLDSQYRTVTSDLNERANGVVFSYFIVAAVIVKPVLPGEQLLVSYNQEINEQIDHRWNYFMPKDIAQKECGRKEVLCPCLCEPLGCPFNRYFLRLRDSA
jgi:hypothetical protein